MLDDLFSLFNEEVYEYGLNLHKCGCTGEIFKKGNKFFTSISDDNVYNVIITMEKNELIDFHCDCSGREKYCEHLCCAYITILKNKQGIEEINNINNKISELTNEKLKSLLEKSIMFYPSLVEKLNIHSNFKEVDTIISEMKLIVNTINIRNNIQIDKINNIINIYIGEAEFFEKKNMKNEAFLIYSGLLEELKTVIDKFDIDPSSMTSLSILYEKLSKKSKNETYIIEKKVLVYK